MIYRVVFIVWGAVMGFMVAMNASQGSWDNVVVLVAITLIMLVCEIRVVTSARHGYHMGWIKGRTEMVGSLMEARKRGMNELEWLLAEAERDGCDVFEILRASEVERRKDFE